MKFTRSLYFWVILAILTGIFIGAFFPDFAVRLKPLGDGFIKLVKMMIAPVIFCTIVTGIAGMQDTKKVGRVGIKAIVYFEIVTTLALIIGLIVINLIRPGVGMNVDPASLDIKSVESYMSQSKATNVQDFLMHIIPDNAINALATGDLLQVLFFSVLFGFGLSKIGEKATPVLKGIKSLEFGLFAVIRIIMKAAPFGGACGFVGRRPCCFPLPGAIRALKVQQTRSWRSDQT
jgi:aerobic C4-dicarboxylate transport protein